MILDHIREFSRTRAARRVFPRDRPVGRIGLHKTGFGWQNPPRIRSGGARKAIDRSHWCRPTGRCAVIWWRSLVVISGLGVFLAGATVSPPAQVVRREREATVTGPRGRSVDRKLEVERGPGGYERHLQIQRPGATLERDFRIQPVPRGGYVGGGWGPRPMIFERNVFVAPRPGPAWSFGFMAAPMLTFPFWQSTPPPVVVAAPPAVIAPSLVPLPSPNRRHWTPWRSRRSGCKAIMPAAVAMPPRPWAGSATRGPYRPSLCAQV